MKTKSRQLERKLDQQEQDHEEKVGAFCLVCTVEGGWDTSCYGQTLVLFHMVYSVWIDLYSITFDRAWVKLVICSNII